MEIYPIKEIAPFEIIERGNLEKISIYSGASKILEGRKVSQRQISGAKEIIGKLKLPIEERINYFPTSSPGSYICITAKFQNTILGTDNLGKIGKSAELIGREAAAELLKEESRKASLDKHLVDQILIYMALSKGKCRISTPEITQHARTNMEIIRKFIKGRFKIKDNIISWIPFSS